MKVFLCNDHVGHYPVGSASVVIARDEAHAREMLDAQLRAVGLEPNRYTFQVLDDVQTPRVIVLLDGNY